MRRSQQTNVLIGMMQAQAVALRGGGLKDIAHVLGITKVAVTTCHFLALERLREVLGDDE